MQPNPYTGRFARLFKGFDKARGTDEGGWKHEPVTLGAYSAHLAGVTGLGIAPLREDGTVLFGAIDLDEPNFELMRDLQDVLAGPSWLAKSKSGNAHLYVFFDEPIEGWIVRSMLKRALLAVQRPHVEVFPKQDRLMAGRYGNYVRLPYFGHTRPALDARGRVMTLPDFVGNATTTLNEAAKWRKYADMLRIPSPEARHAEQTEFGTQPYLHKCALWIVENRETRPVTAGSRNVVYFRLACQLANCSQYDDDDAMYMLAIVNDASPDPIPEGELRRIYRNATIGQYTATGCDDPLFQPYAHPDCPIAHGDHGGTF